MKIQRLLKRVLLIGIVGFLAYGLYDPASLPHPFLEKPMTALKAHISQPEVDLGELASAATKQAAVLGLQSVQQTALDESSLPTEVSVDDIVQLLQEELKQKPRQEAVRIGQTFCEDLGYVPKETLPTTTKE